MPSVRKKGAIVPKNGWMVPPVVRPVLPEFAGHGGKQEAQAGDGGSNREADGDPALGNCQVRVLIPIRTVSGSNSREHWAKRAKRVGKERSAAYESMIWHAGISRESAQMILSRNPSVVLTRIAGPRGKTLDDDNLRGCLKAIRDGVADSFGIADNDPRVSWDYAQRKADYWGVDVEVFV